MASQAGIHGAALAPWPIFEGGGWSEQVIIPGKGPSEREEIFYNISPGYFATLRTPLVAGRDFEPRDSDAHTLMPAIVNQAFARRYFDSLDVVGREFRYGKSSSGRDRGTASDSRYYDLRASADPI